MAPGGNIRNKPQKFIFMVQVWGRAGFVVAVVKVDKKTRPREGMRGWNRGRWEMI